MSSEVEGLEKKFSLIVVKILVSFVYIDTMLSTLIIQCYDVFYLCNRENYH